MNLFDNNVNDEMRSIVQGMVREASNGSQPDGLNPRDSQDDTIVAIRESEPPSALQPGTRVKTTRALKSSAGELPAGTVATVMALMPDDQITIRFDHGPCWAVSTCLVEVIPCPYALGSHVRLKQAVNEQLPVGTVATVVGIAPGGHTNMVMARVPAGACWAFATSIIEPASAAFGPGATMLPLQAVTKRPWYKQPWFIALSIVLSLTAVGFGAWAIYEQVQRNNYLETYGIRDGPSAPVRRYETEERTVGIDTFPVSINLVKKWPKDHSKSKLPETPFSAEIYEGSEPKGSSSQMQVINIKGDILEVEKKLECMLCMEEIEPGTKCPFVKGCGHLQCCGSDECRSGWLHWKESFGQKCMLCNK